MAGDEEVVRFFDCDSLTCLSEFKSNENRYFFFFFFLHTNLCVLVCGGSLINAVAS